MSYEIEFTDEEEKTITNCVTLLKEICTIMKDHDCTHMVNTSTKVIMADIDTINEILEILNNLVSVDSIE